MYVKIEMNQNEDILDIGLVYFSVFFPCWLRLWRPFPVHRFLYPVVSKIGLTPKQVTI